MKKPVITGTGRFVPPHVVSNQDLTQWMETSTEWIQQRTVLFVALGSGLTWGANIHRFT